MGGCLFPPPRVEGVSVDVKARGVCVAVEVEARKH